LRRIFIPRTLSAKLFIYCEYALTFSIASGYLNIVFISFLLLLSESLNTNKLMAIKKEVCLNENPDKADSWVSNNLLALWLNNFYLCLSKLEIAGKNINRWFADFIAPYN